MRPWFVVAVIAAVGAVGVGCSGSDDSDAPDDTGVIGRIDGPAVVDPSYDPFAVDTTTVP